MYNPHNNAGIDYPCRLELIAEAAIVYPPPKEGSAHIELTLNECHLHEFALPLW